MSDDDDDFLSLLLPDLDTGSEARVQVSVQGPPAAKEDATRAQAGARDRSDPPTLPPSSSKAGERRDTHTKKKGKGPEGGHAGGGVRQDSQAPPTVQMGKTKSPVLPPAGLPILPNQEMFAIRGAFSFHWNQAEAFEGSGELAQAKLAWQVYVDRCWCRAVIRCSAVQFA